MASIIDPSRGGLLSLQEGLAFAQRNRQFDQTLEEKRRQFDQTLDENQRQFDIGSGQKERYVQIAEGNLALNQGRDLRQDELHDLAIKQGLLQLEAGQFGLESAKAQEDRVQKQFDWDYARSQDEFGWASQVHDMNMRGLKRDNAREESLWLSEQAQREALMNGDLAALDAMSNVQLPPGVSGPMETRTPGWAQGIMSGWRAEISDPSLTPEARAMVNARWQGALQQASLVRASDDFLEDLDEVSRNDRFSYTDRFGNKTEASEGVMQRIAEIAQEIESDPMKANLPELRREFNEMLSEADRRNAKERRFKAALDQMDEMGSSLVKLLGPEIGAAAWASMDGYLRTSSELPENFTLGKELYAMGGDISDSYSKAADAEKSRQPEDTLSQAIEVATANGVPVVEQDPKTGAWNVAEGFQTIRSLFGGGQQQGPAGNRLTGPELGGLMPPLYQIRSDEDLAHQDSAAGFLGLPQDAPMSGQQGPVPGQQPVAQQGGGAPAPDPSPAPDPGPQPEPKEVVDLSEVEIQAARSRGDLNDLPKASTGLLRSRPNKAISEMVPIYLQSGESGVRTEMASRGWDPDSEQYGRWMEQIRHKAQLAPEFRSTVAFHSSGLSEGKQYVDDLSQFTTPGGMTYENQFEMLRKNWKRRKLTNNTILDNRIRSNTDTEGPFTPTDFYRWMIEAGHADKAGGLYSGGDRVSGGWNKLLAEYARDMGYIVRVPRGVRTPIDIEEPGGHVPADMEQPQD